MKWRVRFYVSTKHKHWFTSRTNSWFSGVYLAFAPRKITTCYLEGKINFLKWSCCDSKPKTTAWDKRPLSKILISNRFAYCGEIPKAWNDARVAVFRSTTPRGTISLDMNVIFRFRSNDKSLNINESAQYRLEIIKIDRLFNGTSSSSIMNQESVFLSMIGSMASRERHKR